MSISEETCKAIMHETTIEVAGIPFAYWECSNCGEELYPYFNYCPNCGRKIEYD